MGRQVWRLPGLAPRCQFSGELIEAGEKGGLQSKNPVVPRVQTVPPPTPYPGTSTRPFPEVPSCCPWVGA